MGRVAKVLSSVFKTRSTAPGKSIVVKTIGAGGAQRTAEMYHNPGISSAPTKSDRVIEIPIGNSGTRVIVASHNYRVEVEPAAGETIIYSTNTAGDTVQSTIKLDADGNIEINGDSKSFVTYAELNTALQSLVTAINTTFGTKLDGGGTTGALSLDISAAETTTVKTGG